MSGTAGWGTIQRKPSIGSTILSALGPIGGVLGGVGQIAGAFLGGSSKTPKISEDNIRESIKNQLYAARTFGPMYGFHPLAALGISPSSASQAQSVGLDMRGMGQGLDRALGALSELDPRIRKLNELKLAQERERLRNMRLQNTGLLKELQDKTPQTGPPIQPSVPGRVSAYNPNLREVRKKPATYQGHEAVSSAYYQAHSRGTGLQKQYIFTPNEQLMDMISEPGSSYWLRETVRDLKMTGKLMLNTKGGRAIAKTFESYAQGESPAPPGYRWVWSNWAQAVVLKPIPRYVPPGPKPYWRQAPSRSQYMMD